MPDDLGQSLDGAHPVSTLASGLDGYLYGTTSNYAFGFGTVFKLATNGASFHLLHTFSGTDGENPTALTQATDQNFYGVTTFVTYRWGAGGTIGFSTLRYGAWIGLAAGVLLLFVAVAKVNAVRRTAP